jgi:hypothetical protein
MTTTAHKPRLHDLLSRLKSYNRTHHFELDGYDYHSWSELVPARTGRGELVSSELIDNPGRHAILLDLDFMVGSEPTNRSGQQKLTMLVPGTTFWAGRVKKLGSTARELDRLDDGLRAAGMAGIIDVVPARAATWHPTRSGRYHLELVITADLALVKSSTKGHRHLYVDIPGGLPTEQYRTLRRALHKAHVIEEAHTWGDQTYLRPPGAKKTTR